MNGILLVKFSYAVFVGVLLHAVFVTNAARY